MMYLYAVTNSVFEQSDMFKLGRTGSLYERLKTYQTGSPPGYELYYKGIFYIGSDKLDDAKNAENILHNKFKKYRMLRQNNNPTEWFHVPYTKIEAFMSAHWIMQNIEDVLPKQHKLTKLIEPFDKNIYFLQDEQLRRLKLDAVQKPAIDTIGEFILSDETAGYVVSPCGSGKTQMLCLGIKTYIKKCIICCPTRLLQRQWKNTLIQLDIAEENDILLVNSGASDLNRITEFTERDRYFIISTYMSSDTLLNIYAELFVFDEAHHLTGDSNGPTRQLLDSCKKNDYKRISLTYTPVYYKKTDDFQVFSMDDIGLFGRRLVDINIRNLIKNGILPDYRICMLHDNNESNSELSKTYHISEAWKSTEIVDDVEVYILHHLIIFTSSHEISTMFGNKLRDLIDDKDTTILVHDKNENIYTKLHQFKTAKRAILINCKILGEGVDIPIANAVAITYPKFSSREIIQMLLRAGRWYQNKPIFHIILPVVNSDDMSGFERVLLTLARGDDTLNNEIFSKYTGDYDNVDAVEKDDISISEPEIITIEYADGASIEDIKSIFQSCRMNIIGQDKKKIQELCRINNIDTSVDYRNIFLQKYPEYAKLGEEVIGKNTWYDFLHEYDNKRMTLVSFKKLLKLYKVTNHNQYKDFTDVSDTCPDLQYIEDGYFNAAPNMNLILSTLHTDDSDIDTWNNLRLV